MKSWLYPANVKYYDVVAAFTQEEATAWPMNSKVNVGDFVYMYLGAPLKQILFKCQVIEINKPIDDVEHQAQKYAKVSGKKPNKDFMLLKTVVEFESISDGPLSFTALRGNGLKGSIMGPQCLDNNKQLHDYIKKAEA